MIDESMQEFLGACGSGGPLVLGVEDAATSGVSWRIFDQPFVVVGRDSKADLRLNDPEVSRRHAYFQVIAGRPFCVDLQSRTGTHWGGEPGLWGWVHADPGVRIGPYLIRARGDEGGPSVTTARGSTLPVPVSRSFEQPRLAEARLEVLGTSDGSAAWRVSRALVLIGSSRACKVQLQGGGVADIHASLLRTPAGVFLVDLLLGQGDLLVNGKRVRFARLGEDDEIAVGTHRLRIRCGPERSARSIGRENLPARARDGGAVLAETGDDPESLLRSLIGEFGQVQAQTAAGFQEVLIRVLHSFAEIHREQMDLIREELGRLRELTAEQQQLRSQVERQGMASPGPPTLRLVDGDSSPAVPATSAAPPSSPTARGGGKEAARPVTPAPAGGPAAPPRPIGISDPAGLHTRIFDRLAEIQGERQGRWQKLMDALVGKSG